MRLKSLFAAFALVGLSLGPSFASQAVVHYPYASNTVADARLRAGPGSYFPQIDIIPRGYYLEVQECSNGFCRVWRGGGEPDGWVSSSLIISYWDIPASQR